MISLTPVDWQVEAKCAELPILKSDAMFFPERGGSSKAARALCSECPVQPECLEYALQNQEQHGIWGGTSERERRRFEYERYHYGVRAAKQMAKERARARSERA